MRQFHSPNEERHLELAGARIVDVRLDGGLVYLTLDHKGCDDDACTVLLRASETVWLFPETVVPGGSVAKGGTAA